MSRTRHGRGHESISVSFPLLYHATRYRGMGFISASPWGTEMKSKMIEISQLKINKFTNRKTSYQIKNNGRTKKAKK